jgi:hypothetical protein
LKEVDIKWESDEYRWMLIFLEYIWTISCCSFSDDETVYPRPPVTSSIDELEKEMKNVNAKWESDEYRWLLIVLEYIWIVSCCSFSDDETVYPRPRINKLQKVRSNIEEKWHFVQTVDDVRPEPLTDFTEKAGPTFFVGPTPPPSVFFREMLPDELFDHIVMCTNTRARVHFQSSAATPNGRNKWKEASVYWKENLLPIDDFFMTR